MSLINFQLDEYHDRLEDFPEEDEDINSDDDTNNVPAMSKLAKKAMQGRAFKMEVMNYWRAHNVGTTRTVCEPLRVEDINNDYIHI